MTDEFSATMIAPARRRRLPKARPTEPAVAEPEEEDEEEGPGQMVEVTLPNGAKAMVPMSTMRAVPIADYEGQAPNFRCMYRNTTEPTGHPDFYARREDHDGGFVVCPICGNTAVLQIGPDPLPD